MPSGEFRSEKSISWNAKHEILEDDRQANPPLSPIAKTIYHMFHSLYLEDSNRRYDLQTIEVMKRNLTRDSICIDVGAHSGGFLRQMIELAPDGHHFAFEPIPHLAESLSQSFPQAHVHQCALSDHTGQATFKHVVNDPGYSGLKERVYDRPDPQIEEIVVRVDRLDDLIPPNLEVAFIKIDVEGAEYHVMRGGIETIKRCQPLIVFEAGEKSTACYGATPDQIADLLITECGMNISTMDRWLRGLPSYSQHSFISSYNNVEDYYFIAYPGSPASL